MGERKETLFHLSIKVDNHARSEWKPQLRQITGSDGCTACSKSIIRRRRDLLASSPGLSQLLMFHVEVSTCNIKSWVSNHFADMVEEPCQGLQLMVPTFCLVPNWRNSERKPPNLSAGRRSSPICVSISIP